MQENFGFTVKFCLPKDEAKGPTALASAPSDLSVPITAPFWSALPYADVMAVKQGITMAEPTENQR